MNGVADLECGDIDGEDLGKILRKAADFDGSDVLLEKAAVGFDAIGFADGFDGDAGEDFLGHGDGLEIDMQDGAGDGVVLDFLDEGKLGGFFGTVLDLEFDEDVLTDRVGEEGLEVAAGDFEIGGSGFVTVDDGWNGAAGADAFDGIAAAFGAGTGGELNLLGHGMN